MPQRHWVISFVPWFFIFGNRGQVNFSSCHFFCLYLSPPGFLIWFWAENLGLHLKLNAQWGSLGESVKPFKSLCFCLWRKWPAQRHLKRFETTGFKLQPRPFPENPTKRLMQVHLFTPDWARWSWASQLIGPWANWMAWAKVATVGGRLNDCEKLKKTLVGVQWYSVHVSQTAETMCQLHHVDLWELRRPWMENSDKTFASKEHAILIRFAYIFKWFAHPIFDSMVQECRLTGDFNRTSSVQSDWCLI